ncbi:Uncharacterised protein [Bordetella pertussis]|nr:Uncharacterised protein [Bordetella pertussis]CPJ09983.1 Uncharacterised protein [Bordetella pertussis]CPO31826.1 Uncharacterised protein [Bordetella pertussis]
MPPNTEAPRHDEPISECGSRPSGASVCSSWSRVDPGKQMTWRPSRMSWIFFMRIVLMITISRS